jgi:hypothetical protein
MEAAAPHHGEAQRMTKIQTARPVPRWAIWAAHAAVLSTVPSGLWRIAMGLRIPVGFSETGLREFAIPGWGLPYVIGLSLVAEGLAFLTLGLVRGWGEIAPRWLPLIGGRRIPPLAAVIPAAAGAIAVTMITITAALGWAHAGDTMPVGSMAPDPHHIYAIVMTLCYAPLLAWGPLLAAVTIQYHMRRRKGVTRLVKAPKEETTSTSFAAS